MMFITEVWSGLCKLTTKEFWPNSTRPYFSICALTVIQLSLIPFCDNHILNRHLERNIDPPEFSKAIRHILDKGGSINLYMFHGGTNFGFMNGANWEEDGMYKSTVSSYGGLVCVC